MTRSGRLVVFESDASNLVAGDTNGASDVFLRDSAKNRTWRVSLARDGTQGNGDSFGGAISADGRVVAFVSDASNLVPHDTNGTTDVFVRDLQTGSVRRINVGPGGRQADGRSFGAAISADGRFVAFSSEATNLVSGDTNGAQDIFTHDLKAGVTRRISVSTGGGQSNAGSFGGALSADGRYIAFSSDASNLVPDDTNLTPDVFVYDRVLGTTERASVGPDGRQADVDSFSFGEDLSADGRYVSFQSGASNLVDDDFNGTTDVFVRDRKKGTTERVVIAPKGIVEDTGNVGATLSPNGRFVAVSSFRPSGGFDAYIVERRTGKTRLLSKPLAGTANGSSFLLAISGDGQRAVFYSDASNLVSQDTNGKLDVFLRELLPW